MLKVSEAKNKKIPIPKSTGRRGHSDSKPASNALVMARAQVKDFMTDSQKSFILGREGKMYMDGGDLTRSY